MSGYSDLDTCPNCGNGNYQVSIDWKPFSLTSTFCLDCGFQTFTHVSFASLEEVNIERSDMAIEEWDFDPKEGARVPQLSKLADPTEWAKKEMQYYLTEKED
jgi:hypothetical protein